MIRYNLKCAKEHEFDSWFSSSEDFDKLKKSGMIACSICGDTDVQKAIMAPRIANKEEDNKSLLKPSSPAEVVLKELRKELEKSADNVGKNFATEARKIHYGETKERPIIGEANLEEAKSLIDEGVPITPLPWQDKKTN